jgi:hypothetical protein
MSTQANTANSVRILRPQALQLESYIRHHYLRRHDGRGNEPARRWIDAYRRWLKATGYKQHMQDHINNTKASA